MSTLTAKFPNTDNFETSFDNVDRIMQQKWSEGPTPPNPLAGFVGSIGTRATGISLSAHQDAVWEGWI